MQAQRQPTSQQATTTMDHVQKRKEKIEALLNRAEQGDYSAVRCIADEDNWWTHRSFLQRNKFPELLDRLDAAYRAAREQREFNQKELRTRKLYRQWRCANSPLQELQRLQQLRAHLVQCSPNVQQRFADKLGFTMEGLFERTQALIRMQCDILAGKLNGTRSVWRLHRFIQEIEQARYYSLDYGDGRMLDRYDSLQYPAGWQMVVAKYIYDPPLELYGNFGRKELANNLRQRAADTLEREDLAAAKFILAVCDSFEGHRAAVGEILYADLAKFVSSQQPNLGPGQR